MRSPDPTFAIAGLLATLLPATADPTAAARHLFGVGPLIDEYNDFDPDAHAERSGFAPFSPADSDLGVQEILRPAPPRAPVRVDVSNELLWTNNAPARIPGTDEPSWMWIGRAAAGWRPRLAGPWFADLGLVQEVLRFDDSAAIDFENLETRLGVVANLADLDDLLVFARHEFSRLTTGSLSEGDYHAQRIRVGAQKVLWAAARHEILAGLDAAFDLSARPKPLRRNEYAADLGYRWHLTNALEARAYCRVSYFDYDTTPARHDWAWNPGLDLIWTFSDWGRLYVSVYFSENDSNTPFGFNDYESWTTGLGIGANFKF